MPTLTIFSAPKPFTHPHIATIQRNAIRSWQLLGDEVDVLLLGEEEGLADAAAGLGVRHISQIKRNENGTPLISSMLQTVRANSDAGVLVLINADIILLPGFVESVHQVEHQAERFLIIGHRWDLDVPQLLEFGPGWDSQMKLRIQTDGKLHKSKGSDYFAFKRDQFEEYPDFAIGRAGWDNWTIYHARAQGWAVVDATHDIAIIHQTHDYHHLPGGIIHYTLPESDENLRLAGGKRFIFTLLDANKVLVDGIVQPYPRSFTKWIRDFETIPVLKSRSRFWMDVFFYITHPVKLIRHKLPWLAKVLGLKGKVENDPGS